jgi:hypothetical protein
MYEIAFTRVEADAAFMAHARQDVSALLAEFDATRATLRDVRAALRELSESQEVDREDLEPIVARVGNVGAVVDVAPTTNYQLPTTN